MPATKFLGRRWQVPTDVLPFFALFGAFLHCIWILYIAVAVFITAKVTACDDTGIGRSYLSVVCLFFVLYVISLFTEAAMAVIGLRGTPLEASKRRWIQPFLYIQVTNWILQLGLLGWGTYVVSQLSPHQPCWQNRDRQIVVKILVYTSWCMIIILNWGRLLILYNIAPDLQKVKSWVWRIRLLAWLGGNRDVINRLQSDEEHPLESLSSLYADLMRGADLTPSDEVVALLLLAAHQRNMRKRHMKRKLAGKSCCQGHAEECKSRDAGTPAKHTSDEASPDDSSHAGSSNGAAKGSCASSGNGGDVNLVSRQQNGYAQQESSRTNDMSSHSFGSQNGSDSTSTYSTDQSESAHAASPNSAGAADAQHAEQTAFQQGQQQQQQQSVSSHQQGHHQQPQQQLQSQKLTPSRPALQGMHVVSGVDVEQGWGRGNDVGDDSDNTDVDEGLDQVTVFEHGKGCGFPCVLTPSSLAAELAPDMPRAQVAEICLGKREHVQQDCLDMAARFAKYAIASYGKFGFEYKNEKQKVASIKLAAGSRFHSYKKNKLVRSKIKTHKQRLHYEAVIQVAEIKDEDLLYLNFNNTVMGDVPYIICLDRPTKSIVLGIRGTQSVADAATDLLAYPKKLDRWLPKNWKESGEDMYGHAGMLGAAAAVWEDLRNNHILSALLDLPADEECKPHRDEGSDRQYDSRMSRSEKEHHLEWEAGISDHPADQHPSTKSGKDAADKCARGAKACHGGRNCHDAPGENAAAADRQAQHVAQGAQDCRNQQDSDGQDTRGESSTDSSSHLEHGFSDQLQREAADDSNIACLQHQEHQTQQDQQQHDQQPQTHQHDKQPHQKQHEQQANVKQQQRSVGSEEEGCCGLSLDELGHEGLGQKQELRSSDDQNKFVAAMIRKGLYCDGWKLVITGHSLGAGVAALLTLKIHQRVPGVRCWAFCPPGGLVSQNLSHAAEPYCTSVIVNKDMVPRLSLQTVYRLFEGKMIAMARCNVTACRVLLHALMARSRRVLLSDPSLFRRWADVSQEAKDMLYKFQQRPAEDSISALGLQVGLYPPGRQIFLRRFKRVSQPQKPEDVYWDAVWIKPEEIIGEGILVSKHATNDHYPYSLLTALQNVTEGILQPVKRKTF